MACHSAGTITTSSAFDIRDCIVVAPVAERSERRFDRVTHKTMLAAFLVRKGDLRCTRDVSPRGRGTWRRRKGGRIMQVADTRKDLAHDASEGS